MHNKHVNNNAKLLGLLQSGFPLTSKPYSEIGRKLNISGDEIIRLVRYLKESGIIREISPVLDARKIGYQSTLIAMKVSQQNLCKAENIVKMHDGISHAYERENEYNLWFTLSLLHTNDIQDELNKLSSQICCEAVLALPAVRIFKLRTNFGLDEESNEAETQIRPCDLSEKITLSQIERDVINILQEDLPLVPEPFQGFANRLNLSVDKLLSVCQNLLNKGVFRRYGASVNHYRAGYGANAMTCWYINPECIEKVATRIAKFRQVSHCYERMANIHWNYNLYVMIHGKTKTSCMDTVNRISKENNIKDFIVLFSIKEFKKTRIRYPV